jgi:hypothetical protein
VRFAWLPDVVRVRGYTRCSLARLRALQRHVGEIQTRGLRGVVVECGVAQGGSAAAIMMALARGSDPLELILFDTFAGLPPPSVEDPDYDLAVEYTGSCAGSLDEVRQLFHALRLPAPRCIQGLFQDTLHRTETGPIALLHLDGDWYESTMTCLRVLWPRVVAGGFVQIDDYGYWQGCRKAVTEYFGDQQPVLHDIDGVGVWLQKQAV